MPTQIPVKHCFKDVKVVRGKDWGWKDQDGGEGNIGVIIEEGIGGKWVKVKWSRGYRESYRIGHDNCYDLYFADEKDALLQKAMERFPSGCSYTDPWGVAFLDVTYEKQTPYFIGTSQIALAFNKGLVYSDGLWAQKLSTHAVSTATNSAAFSSKPEIKAEALIEECKKRFPVGCRVEVIDSSGNAGVITGEITAQQHCSFKIYDPITMLVDIKGVHLFFHALVDGESKWARIVEYKGVKEKQWYYYGGKQVFIECITATDFEFSYLSEFTGASIRSRVHLIYAYKFAYITSSDSAPLSGQALLEECKRRFPEGCKVRDTRGDAYVVRHEHMRVSGEDCDVSVSAGYLYDSSTKKWATILEPAAAEHPLTPATELPLAEAKIRFPPGTLVKLVQKPNCCYPEHERMRHIRDDHFLISLSGGIYYPDSNGDCKGYLYYMGKWATAYTSGIEAVTEKTDEDGFNPTQIRAPLNLTISLLTDEED